MEFALQVFNPSHYERGGHVTTPWQLIYQETGIKPEQLVLLDNSKTELPYQIDKVDPTDNSRDVLSFSLARPIEKHASTSVRLVKGTPTRPEWIEPQIEIVSADGQDRGVRLVNSQLEVWLNLVPAPENDGHKWYSGSATSVQLRSPGQERSHGQEMLGYRSGMFRNPETRCMQLDFIQLSCPAWEPLPIKRIHLFDKPYKVVSKKADPIRATVTIASKEFDYSYRDPLTHENYRLSCSLYRVISLYAGADYLLEELFIKAVPASGKSRKKVLDLFFTAQYFTCLNIGELEVSYYDFVPDWFAIRSVTRTSRSFHGYGFATNAHTNPVSHPHPGFPNRGREAEQDGSFSWQLLPHTNAQCLHLFRRYFPDDGYWPAGLTLEQVEEPKSRAAKYDFEDRTGRAWYEIIYKPLWATLVTYPPHHQAPKSTP